jgi:hypothetical protein
VREEIRKMIIKMDRLWGKLWFKKQNNWNDDNILSRSDFY